MQPVTLLLRGKTRNLFRKKAAPLRGGLIQISGYALACKLGDKVKDKTAQFQEKHDLEPKKNEFELTHNREVKKERSRDQGMSL